MGVGGGREPRTSDWWGGTAEGRSRWDRGLRTPLRMQLVADGRIQLAPATQTTPLPCAPGKKSREANAKLAMAS